MENNEKDLPPIILSEPQTDVFNARSAIIADIAGQGSGKTENIGLISGYKIINFPSLKGFIAANTYVQLSQSTLNKVFAVWLKYYGLSKYDKKQNPGGHFVVDTRPPSHFKQNETFKDYRNIVSFINGAIVFVGSLDNYLAHDGKEFAWAHLDETKDTREEALTTVILSRLRQTGLYYLNENPNTLVYEPDFTTNEASAAGLTSFQPAYIHTSPSSGGVEWLLKLLKIDKKEEEIKDIILNPNKYYYTADQNITVVIYQTFWNAENLPNNYISKQLARFNEEEALKFVYGFPFGKVGGGYFNGFNTMKHVRKLEFDRFKTYHLGFDFNVVPYMTMLVSNVDLIKRYYNEDTKEKQSTPGPGFKAIDVLLIKIVKEYCLESPNNSVKAICETFIEDISNIDGTLPETSAFIYGDASGRARIIGFGNITQYDLIQDNLNVILDKDYLRVPRSNGRILTRRDIVNDILTGENPYVELLIDENCEQVIRDFKFLKLGPDGKLKEKTREDGVTYENIGHASDVVEYIITWFVKNFL